MKYELRLRKTVDVTIEADTAFDAKQQAYAKHSDFDIMEIHNEAGAELEVCEICQKDIDPEKEKYAIDDEDGYYVCGDCITEHKP